MEVTVPPGTVEVTVTVRPGRVEMEVTVPPGTVEVTVTVRPGWV